MDTLTRVQRSRKRFVRAERRLVLVQAMFWPIVALASLGAAAAVVARYRNRDTGGVPSPVDGLPHL